MSNKKEQRNKKALPLKILINRLNLQPASQEGQEQPKGYFCDGVYVLPLLRPSIQEFCSGSLPDLRSNLEA